MEMKMQNAQVSTLRPGLLVSLKTSIKGNVSYFKTTIEGDHIKSDGSKEATWETTRKIVDPDEHERAQQARSKARHIVASVCSASEFGYLCPAEKKDKLDAAIAEARKVADEFNETATVSNVGIYIVCGRVEQSDVEAVRAINSEVRDLLDAMQDGLRNLDVKAVRAAAKKAKGLGQMLSDDASEKITTAIEAARKSAKAIVKAGEGAAVEIDNDTIKSIGQQRVAFLDLSDTVEVEAPVNTGTGRALDLGA